jgi:hypothetical protein
MRQIYEELEQVFDHIPKQHIKNVTDFKEKFGEDDILKLTVGNKSLHKESYDNGFPIVNFATEKYGC